MHVSGKCKLLVGDYGKEADSTTFMNSQLRKKFYTGQLNMPKHKILPNLSGKPQPILIVTDEGFALYNTIT